MLDTFGMMQELLSCRRQRDTGGSATDQPGMKRGFQACQPARHGCVVAAPMLGSRCQAALPCNGQQYANIVPILQTIPLDPAVLLFNGIETDCPAAAHCMQFGVRYRSG